MLNDYIETLEYKIKTLEKQLKKAKAYTEYAVAKEQEKTAKFKKIASQLAEKLKNRQH